MLIEFNQISTNVPIRRRLFTNFTYMKVFINLKKIKLKLRIFNLSKIQYIKDFSLIFFCRRYQLYFKHGFLK